MRRSRRAPARPRGAPSASARRIIHSGASASSRSARRPAASSASSSGGGRSGLIMIFLGGMVGRPSHGARRWRQIHAHAIARAGPRSSGRLAQPPQLAEAACPRRPQAAHRYAQALRDFGVGQLLVLVLEHQPSRSRQRSSSRSSAARRRCSCCRSDTAPRAMGRRLADPRPGPRRRLSLAAAQRLERHLAPAALQHQAAIRAWRW